MNVEMPAESTDSRAAVFDLKCKDKEGRIFIVEVQNAPQTYFYERGLYYLCRIISDQDRRGNDWKFELYPGRRIKCVPISYWRIVRPENR